jgi:glycosyltransferase involved in cell wall biosynthesis
MTEYPLFSVVTPSYNQAQYLEKTIDSILSQGYPNLEYIIVDGGSKDGSVDIIRKYEKHLAWWVSEPDKGQAEAVNKGFARCTGTFLGWLNSDDLFEPGALLIAAEALLKHPVAGMVFGDVRSIDADGNTFNIMHFNSWGLEDLMCFKVIGQPGVFMRRAVQQQVGYLDASYHYLLDHHFWLLMLKMAPMVYIPKVLAAARFHPLAKNMSKHAYYQEDAYRIVAWMQEQPDLVDQYKRLQRKIWAGAHRLGAHYLLDGKQPGAALKLYWKSLLSDPPTALQESHRMLYAMLSLVGLSRLGPLYLKLKRRKYQDS